MVQSQYMENVSGMLPADLYVVYCAYMSNIE